MPRSVTVRAPTRLDFGGGWTDVAPFADEHGGAVCNLAITRYATATVSCDDDPVPVAATSRGDPLAQAAIRCSSLPHAVAVVTNDFPLGAGLGGSSAAGIALAGGLAALAGEPIEPAALAERSRRTEVEELRIAGGFQDHYAAAFGGALLLTSGAGVGPVHVERIALDDSLADALARRIVLLYTGESRISARTIAAVADGCRARESTVLGALQHMKRLALRMADALRCGDVDALGELVGEHWLHQRTLHHSITTQRIEAIHAACARHGALGMKALGASGGGCVMAVAREGREDELAAALAPLGQRLSFGVDRSGFRVLPTREPSMEGRP